MGRTVHVTWKRKGFAMTYTVKMTMFLYVVSLGIIVHGFNGFLLPH